MKKFYFNDPKNFALLLFFSAYFFASFAQNSTKDVSNNLNSNPIVTFDLPEEYRFRCHYHPTFEITGGSPLGGKYYLNGVEITVFEPYIVQWDFNHVITYEYADSSGFSGSDTASVYVAFCGLDQVLENESLKGLKIYPNPNNGSFNLISETSLNDAQIEIYNALGQIIYSNPSINIFQNNPSVINLSGAQVGIYFIRVIHKNSSITQKITIR